MHDAVIRYVSEHVHLLGLDGGDVLDLGGRDVNGTTRSLFPNATSYLTVDIAPHESVDVVADAATLDLDRTFDVVVSTECLEHTDKGPEIVATAYLHLRPSGVFIATMAGPGRAPHGAGGEPSPPPGEWYRNVEPDELAQWLRSAGFIDWSIDVAGLDVRCWACR
jgi:SAM-dependent methyltransferase